MRHPWERVLPALIKREETNQTTVVSYRSTMSRENEISEDMRRVVTAHQSGQGYQTIFQRCVCVCVCIYVCVYSV